MFCYAFSMFDFCIFFFASILGNYNLGTPTASVRTYADYLKDSEYSVTIGCIEYAVTLTASNFSCSYAYCGALMLACRCWRD